MKLGVACTAFCLAFSLGCSATPAPKSTDGAIVRATARAAVDVARDAWVLVTDAAVRSAQSGDVGVESAAAQPLMTAHDLIVDAAVAVDNTWNTSAVCALIEATADVAKAAAGIPGLSSTTRATVADADSMAKGLLGAAASCGDGGAK